MTNKPVRHVLASLLILLLCATGALASSADIRANLDEAGVGIEANASYRAITVRITGEGQVVERSFTADDLAYIPHAEFNLPDGQYRFEAVLTPDVDNLVRRARNHDGTRNARKDGNTVSGSFRIEGGAIVLDRGESEAPLGPGPSGPANHGQNPDGLVSTTLADQVFIDDLIVDGSACVGMDCANGENFGFDTLRLKENNLRIKFDDTSNSGSFPNNDWQLTANDSDNGGANKFSIDDITGGRTPFTIEAGAASHSLYVDDAGNLGLNTSTPVVEIHLRDGDTPTLRLEQDGSSGFGSQTWDIAGNETNFFVRDVNNGSKLPFKIFPNAPTNSLIVEGVTGDLGVGTQAPTAPLHVRRTNGTARILVEDTDATFGVQLELLKNGTPRIRFDNTNTAGVGVWDFGLDGSDNFLVRDISGSSNVLTLSATGDLTLTGGLITGTAGSCTASTPCDGVFDPEFKVMSIDEQNEQMWAQRYLPAVGPTLPGNPINVTQKLTRVLHELEKAHIYIGQLHQRLQALEAEGDSEAPVEE